MNLNARSEVETVENLLADLANQRLHNDWWKSAPSTSTHVAAKIRRLVPKTHSHLNFFINVSVKLWRGGSGVHVASRRGQRSFTIRAETREIQVLYSTRMAAAEAIDAAAL